MTHRIARRLGRVALAMFVLAGALLSERSLPVVLIAAAVALAVTAVLPERGWSVLAGAAVVGAAVVVLCQGASGNVGWFAFCVLVGWGTMCAGTRPALAITALAAGSLAAQGIFVKPDPGWFAWIAGTVFTLVACVMARRQQDLLGELQVAQAGLTDRARAEERNRIAHELHDVIAHSLTVSLLHLGSARLAVQDEPDEAVAALARAEQYGRDALIEVRRAVGLLHEGAGSLAALPGARQLPDLVEGFRRAGAQVDYTVVGEAVGLPATTGLTVYRILQESLTNVSRHAPGSLATVRLEVDERSVLLTVDNPGITQGRRGEGIGLTSMGERARAVGGELTVGPCDTGWRVRAVLPGMGASR